MKSAFKICSDNILLLAFAMAQINPSAWAQEIIASQGAVTSNGNRIYSFIEGEPVIDTVNNAELIISKGFQKPQKLMVQVYNSKKNIGLKAFPNPTAELLNVIFQKSKLNFILLDITGRTVPLKILKESDQQIEFSFIGLPAGIYMLHVKNTSGDTVSYIHIVKL